MEKILRVQPNVKKVYLLLRAADAESATKRLHNEVCLYSHSNVILHDNGKHNE